MNVTLYNDCTGYAIISLVVYIIIVRFCSIKNILFVTMYNQCRSIIRFVVYFAMYNLIMTISDNNYIISHACLALSHILSMEILFVFVSVYN